VLRSRMLRHLAPLALVLFLGAGSTCNSETPAAPPEGVAKPSGNAPPSASEEQCVDAWLEKAGLDKYGNAKGTVYAGGTPLFDEMTGKSTDRLEYIYQHHADAKAACHK
jgi:hypothetical protein